MAAILNIVGSLLVLICGALAVYFWSQGASLMTDSGLSISAIGAIVGGVVGTMIQGVIYGLVVMGFGRALDYLKAIERNSRKP